MFQGLPKIFNKATVGENLYEKHKPAPELSHRRIGRITGSEVEKIKVKESKATSYKKDDLLAWIQDQPNGIKYLSELVEKYDKESYEKLTIEQIKEVYNSLPGNLELTDGAYSYLDKLTDELLCGEIRETRETDAMKWGKDHEKESLELFKKWYLENVHPTAYFKHNEFFIHPTNKLVGCTNDLSIYHPEYSDIKPFAITENKCPENGANHTACLRTRNYDEKYEEQICLETECAEAKVAYYVSYNPRIKNPEARQFIKKIPREQLQPKIDDLNQRIEVFCEEYERVAKKLGVFFDGFFYALDNQTLDIYFENNFRKHEK